MTKSPPPPEARGRARSCGCLLVALLVVALIGVYAYVGWFRPVIDDLVATQIGTPVVSGPQEQIQEQIAEQMPTVVGALPSGTMTVTDQEVNEYLQANPEAIKPLDAIQVAFTPGLVTAELRALGSTSTASTGLSIADGRIVPVDPTISGPLSILLKADVIASALATQLNNQLSAEGRRATDVKVEQGQLVITLE